MRTKEKEEENGRETRTRTRSYAIAGTIAIAFALIAAMMVITPAAAFEPGECDITVCASGCDYSSIGPAVASANNGDTICVHNGTYAPFDIKYKSSLTVKGEGADVVIIDVAGGRMRIWNGNGGHVFEGFTVKNAGSYEYGFMICEPNCIVRNCIFDNMDAAVIIDGVPNVTFENNVMSNSGRFLVKGSGSSDEIVRGNVFSNSYVEILHGAPRCIVEDNLIVDSTSTSALYIEGDSCTVANNTVINHVGKQGIRVSGSYSYFVDNTVINSTEEWSALYISGGDSCILSNNTAMDNTAARALTIRTSNSVIVNNTLINNAGDGIRIWKTGANNNIITRNNILSNAQGICLRDAGENNKIYLNNFVDNGVSVVYLDTPPATTYWNSTEEIEYTYGCTTYTNYLGNYWSPQYTGSDGDGDGIGDTAYDIPGSATDKDYRPLMQPFENYLEAEAGPEPAIEVNKTVWDPVNETWVEKIEDAKISQTYRFRCEIHNNGTCCDLTDIKVTDNLSASLEYVDGSATVDGVPREPDWIAGNEFGWNFAGPLAPCETITIEFDAHMIECRNDTNTQNATAWCDKTKVSDADTVWVNCTQSPLWHEINAELASLKGNVSAATMPSIIQRRLVDKLEYAKALKENAKIECEAGNFDGATKKLGVAKSQVESFASMVKITRRISPVDKASFLADSTEIIGKIQALIEYIETEHKC